MWHIVAVLVLIGLGSIFGLIGVAVVSSLIALVLASKSVGDDGDGERYRTNFLAVAGACLLPLAAVRWAEASSIIAMAGVLLVSATVFVLGGLKEGSKNGLKEGAVVSFSHLLIRVLTTGFLLSYLPLIRTLEEGKHMTWSFLLALAGMYLASRLSIARLPSRLRGWVSPVLSVTAAVALSAASLLFLPDTVSLVSMVILGITVGTAGLLGESSEKMFSDESPGGGRLWRGLGPLLFAAPAFFYAFRLYLT